MKTAAFVLVFVSCVCVPAFGQSEFRVNSTRDALDNNPGDHVCSTGMLVDGVAECTLRGALMELQSPRTRRGGRIILPRGTYFLTRGTEPGDMSGRTEDFLQAVGVSAAIAVRTRDLDIERDIFIDGEGPELTIIDGTSSDRVFHIPATAGFANQGFSNLTIRRGFVQGRRGGCIAKEGRQGLLSFSNVILEHCLAVESLGGAVFNSGAVIFERSMVRIATAAHGGGLYNEGIAQVFESTFMHNGGQTYFGIQGRGGAIYNAFNVEAASLLVMNSALVENGATVGGALYNLGGATILNSTVSGNSAGSGGGLMLLHGPSSAVWVASSTVANNTGEGIHRATANPLHLRDTILAANLHNPSGAIANCVGGVSTSSESLEDANTCGLVGAGDLPNTDPMIGPLGLNGGLTQTHPLLAGSPAIDAAGFSSESRDQRGFPRPIFEAADIGAYEFGMDDLSLSYVLPIRWRDLFRTPMPSEVGYNVNLSLGSTRSSRAYLGVPHFTSVKPAEGQGQLKIALDSSGAVMQVSGVAVPPKAGANAKKAAADETILFYVDIQRPVKGQAALRLRNAECGCAAKPAKPSRIVLPRVQRPDTK